jgi:uridine phosphorylase
MISGYTSSEHIQDAEGRQYHIGLAPGEVADFVMLVGDPARATRVAGLLDDIELERRHREYVTYTGSHQGLRLSVMATGMGPDNTEIAVIELCQCVRQPTMIRCGSSGGLQRTVALGDLVIAKAAYRLEHTSLQYVGEGYPAVADLEVVLALIQVAEELGLRYHVGITATASGFYGAQGRHLPGFPPRYPHLLAELERQGVLNFEMETSCLLTLASLRGFRAGAVCAVYASRHQDAFISHEDQNAAELYCIMTGLHAFHYLAALDQQRGDKPHWHPGLGADGHSGGRQCS